MYRSNLVERVKNNKDNITWLHNFYSNELYYSKKLTSIDELIKHYKRVTIDDLKMKIAKDNGLYYLNVVFVIQVRKTVINLFIN